MRVFYVLYIREARLSDCLEAIRLLANPTEKSAAHMTVRGPYQRKLPLNRLSDRITGKSIFVHKVGNFFREGQNTVFFSCSSPYLPSVWKKSDFGFNPHITIYDGGSESFARKLYAIMRRHKYSFKFTAGRLEPYVSVRKQNGFHLQLTFNQKLISSILGEWLTSQDVPKLNVKHRLEYIDRICAYISRHFVCEDVAQARLPLFLPDEEIEQEQAKGKSPLSQQGTRIC
jgi:hypothetical protein